MRRAMRKCIKPTRASAHVSKSRRAKNSQKMLSTIPIKAAPAVIFTPKAHGCFTRLRYAIGEEAFWESLRRLLYDTDAPEKLSAPIEARFRTTDDYLEIVNNITGDDYSWFFEVYLRRAPLPVLEQPLMATILVLTWNAPDDLPFPMPVPVMIDGKISRIEMADGTARISGAAKKSVPDRHDDGYFT